MRKAYKIMLAEDGVLKNLFRGINRSRTLDPNHWYEADIKRGRDGSESKWYWTGIHCLPTKEDAEEYLNNFMTEKNRVVVECYITGNRRKPTNDKVILANKMFIPAEEYYKHF